MVRAAGFEPVAPSAQAIDSQIREDPPPTPCAQIGAQIPDRDGRALARIVASWAKMPASLKRAVLAIVEASQGEGSGSDE
jgi:hypothetical protein